MQERGWVLTYKKVILPNNHSSRDLVYRGFVLSAIMEQPGSLITPQSQRLMLCVKHITFIES